MAEGRFTIAFSGRHNAAVRELFPDSGVDMQQLFGDGGPDLSEFLIEWNYAEVLRITVVDNETGEEWEKPAGPMKEWERVKAHD